MDIGKAVVVIDGKQWEKDLPEMGDLEVFVAPWENKQFERLLAKQVNQLPPGLRPDGRPEPTSFYRCLGITMARTIIFDWKNFSEGEVEIPFDAKLAETYLTDPRYRPFRDAVMAAAKRVQQGVKAEDDALEGNSAATLPGAEPGKVAT